MEKHISIRMEQKPMIFPVVIASLFGMVAMIMLVTSVNSAFQTVQRLVKEQSTSGQVVQMVERRVPDDSQKDQYQVYAYPVVTFAMANGQPEQVQLQDGAWPPAYRTGETVTILYNPDQPEQARIQTQTSWLTLWLGPVLTGLIGLTFLMISVVTFRLRRTPDPRKEDPTEFQQEFIFNPEGLE